MNTENKIKVSAFPDLVIDLGTVLAKIQSFIGVLRLEYKKAEVREYWIVEPISKKRTPVG